MALKRKDSMYLLISIVSFGFMSCSFLIMPIDRTNVISGIMFWLFLILGIVAQNMLGMRRRNWLRKDKRRRHKARKGMVGVFSFFKNIPAIASDISFAISLIIFIILMVRTSGVGYSCYLFLAIMIFAFCSHCIFNGKIYQYVIKVTNEGGQKHGKN